MTVTEAIATVTAAGGEFLVPAPGRLQVCVPSPRPPELEAALATLREHREQALALLNASAPKLPAIFKGQAVCLYSDLAEEQIWIAADEEDAQTLVLPGT